MRPFNKLVNLFMDLPLDSYPGENKAWPTEPHITFADLYHVIGIESRDPEVVRAAFGANAWQEDRFKELKIAPAEGQAIRTSLVGINYLERVFSIIETICRMKDIETVGITTYGDEMPVSFTVGDTVVMLSVRRPEPLSVDNIPYDDDDEDDDEDD
jgi:hypothetical protein